MHAKEGSIPTFSSFSILRRYSLWLSLVLSHQNCSILLVLDARMNISDMYLKCFYFTYSNRYLSPRKSRWLDFNLVISVFKKGVRKTESCIFKGLPQHFIHGLSFGSQMLWLCLCWWTEWTRTDMCITKLSFFPHTDLIDTVWQEHQEYP